MGENGIHRSAHDPVKPTQVGTKTSIGKGKKARDFIPT